MNFRRASLIAPFVGLAALAACGGDSEESGADTTPAIAQPEESAAAAAPSATEESEAADAPPSGGLGMGAETFAKQLKIALRAEDYTLDGNTVTMLLPDGTSADSDSDCAVGKATVGTNVSIVLSYADTEVAC